MKREMILPVLLSFGISLALVSYRVVDFSKPEGKDEAKKYEIAWTSLLLIRHDAGDKETVRNISKFAIENARTNTEKFRKQLAEDIGKLLKE